MLDKLELLLELLGGASVFILVIFAVWQVLQVIIFFKVWGMTNDVDKLKARIVDKQEKPVNEVARYFSIKEISGKEAARKYLEDTYQKKVEALLEENMSLEQISFASDLFRTKETRQLMEDAGIPLPEFKDIKAFLYENKKLSDEFHIGDTILYTTQDKQEWRATLLEYDGDDCFRIRLSNNEEFWTSVSSCRKI